MNKYASLARTILFFCDTFNAMTIATISGGSGLLPQKALCTLVRHSQMWYVSCGVDVGVQPLAALNADEPAALYSKSTCPHRWLIW